MEATAVVALQHLHAAPDQVNSRKTNKTAKLDELTANIEQIGLLQPLLVRANGKNGWVVIDGHRRLNALKIIHMGEQNAKVPVRIVDADNKVASVMSLAANIEREDIHEVDAYEAFAELQTQGINPVGIAKIFNVSEKYVLQRLALGQVIEPVRNAYRTEFIGQQTFVKFADCDQARQQEVWDKGQAEGWMGWQYAEALRTKGGYASVNRIIDWIDPDTYLECKGQIERSLFSDVTTYLDEELVENLAREELTRRREQWLKDGWSFAEEAPESAYIYGSYSFHEPDAFELPKKELAEYEKLDALDYGELSHKEQDRYDELSEKGQKFSDKAKAEMGVVIKDWHVYYGCKKRKETDAPSADDKPKEKPMYSDALVRDLNEGYTNALCSSVQRNAEGAVSVLIVSLLSQLSVTYAGRFSDVSMNFDMHKADSPAMRDLQTLLKTFKIKLTGKPETKLKAVRELTQAKRSKLLTYLIGLSMAETRRGTELDKVFDVDPRETFKADEEFFSRLSKPALERALLEMGAPKPKISQSEKPWIERKKGEMVKLCVEHAGDWLPAPIR